jgi:hypothetical protein
VLREGVKRVSLTLRSNPSTCLPVQQLQSWFRLCRHWIHIPLTCHFATLSEPAFKLFICKVSSKSFLNLIITSKNSEAETNDVL